MTGTVLVTGASGFVGRDLVVRLAAAGWQVRAAARRPQEVPAAHGVTRLALPDLGRGDADWDGLVAGATHVVHLAGLAHMTRALPEEAYHAVNAEATRRLAEAARAAGVQRVVLVSSIRAQVGASAQGIVRADQPPSPSDAYGRSKLAAERHLAWALSASATTWVALRPTLVYGPGVKGNMRTLFALARRRLPLPLGALDAPRSLVSLANLASAIEHALVSGAVAGGTYIVADSDPVTVPEIIAALRQGLGRRPGLIRLPLAPARLLLAAAGRGDVWRRVAGTLVVDPGPLRATGWQPPESTPQALEAAMRMEAVGASSGRAGRPAAG